jgi:crotonobetainyl-CoA:carnitine CoA-transferase CaiB-like acyl-CoA transferase
VKPSLVALGEGLPVKAGVPLVDFGSGLYAAFAIASLLARVRAGGAGGHIDVPMFATTIAISALQTSELFGTGRNPRKLGSAHPRNAPYQAFRAADGYFAIAAGNNKLWQQVCEIAGTPELLADPRDDDHVTGGRLRAAQSEPGREIDDREHAYLQVLLDGLRGRARRMGSVVVKMCETSGV